MGYWHQTVESWRIEVQNPVFKKQAALTGLLLVVVLATFARFVAWIETRRGSILDDPVLAMYEPVKLTWLTFFLIYVGLIVGIVYLVHAPRISLLAARAYTIMVLIRMMAMWAVPLDPPVAMIVLRDPFVEILGTGKELTRDLFFSGHTSTMFLLSLVCPHPFLKRLYIGLTVVIGLCVLLQHVHYSIDVFAAPFFAYGAFRLATKL